MTEPSEAAKARAREIFGTSSDRHILLHRVATYIQQVSDTAKAAKAAIDPRLAAADALAPFILPEPVDPLEDLLCGLVPLLRTPPNGETPAAFLAGEIHAHLAKRGLKIVKDDT